MNYFGDRLYWKSRIVDERTIPIPRLMVVTYENTGDKISINGKKTQTSHIQKTSSQNDVVISTETLEAYKQTSKIILSLTQNYPTKQIIIKI